MPIYEYHCEACHYHFEALQKISEGALRKCPECGRSKLKRLISPPVFRLRGSGWYETDFKSDKEGKRNLAVEKDEAPAAGADATPAKKTEDAKTPASPSADAKPAEGAKEPGARDGSSAARKRSRPKSRPRARPRKKGR